MNQEIASRVDRRDWLKGSLGLAGAMMAGASGGPLRAEGRQSSRDPALIRRENEKPGAPDWQLTYVMLDSPTGYRSPGIEGYCSQSDMLSPDRGKTCKAFISIGHDEYWDRREYDAVTAMRDAGVSLLFLSGNSVCWVTPFKPSSDGRPNRIITRAAPYRGLTMGGEPIKDPFPFVGPDEGLLMGARNICPVNGGGDWIVTKPEHWMFAGTGMKKGDRIRGVVGWEFHGMPADIPGLEVVAEGKALHGGVRPVPWTATIYPTPQGGFVFNASTIYWGLGLSNPPGQMLPWSHGSRPHGADDRVQQITHNLLRRAIGG